VAARGTAFAAERETLGRLVAAGGLGAPVEWTTGFAVTLGDVAGELVVLTVGWVVVEVVLDVVLEPLAVTVGSVVVDVVDDVVVGGGV
jgi:hypothetical protein